MTQRLLLAGGGHAHVHVLAALAERPLLDRDGAPVEVTLVSPFERQWYSGMLPGWMAGVYPTEQCVIPLLPLAARARVRYVQEHIARIDLTERVAYTESAAALAFDALSIDTGPVAHLDAVPGATEFALAVRPIERFIVEWVRWLEHFAGSRERAFLSVIGGGAGGVELALAVAAAARLRGLPLEVRLIAGQRGLLHMLPERAGQHALRALTRNGVTVIHGTVASIGRRSITLADGGELRSDRTILATGARAADWPRDAGLAVDAGGFIRVDATLRSVSHPFVFAAGDCAGMDGEPRPRSGVYAVRAGPPLAGNLRRLLAGQPLVPYTPQLNALYLLNTGDSRAIGTWGPLSAEGRWLWRWKDRIDRAFIARFAGRR